MHAVVGLGGRPSRRGETVVAKPEGHLHVAKVKARRVEAKDRRVVGIARGRVRRYRIGNACPTCPIANEERTRRHIPIGRDDASRSIAIPMCKLIRHEAVAAGRDNRRSKQHRPLRGG